MQISEQMKRLQPSPTMAVNQKAKELAAAGKSIINLTVGEPDFVTPQNIIKAAVAALERGETKYTAASGIPELKDAIAKKVSTEYGRDYRREEVIASVGAKQALFNLCLATLNQGDEVIMFSPYWVSYPEMVRFAGGKPVVVETMGANGFVPEMDKLEAVITKRTRMIIINSPTNPTGTVYQKSTLENFLRVAKAWPDILFVTDDIYEKLVFDGEEFASIGMLEDFPSEQLMIVSGVAKSYAMTGWRIGWALGPAPIIKAMGSLQSQSTSNPTTVSQWAAIEAIAGDQTEVTRMCEAFQARRDHVVKFMKDIPHLQFSPPQGTFYIFPDVSHYVGRGGFSTDIELANYLIEDQGLAVVPGTAFGAPGYIRLSYASSTEQLTDGLHRLREGLHKLSA